MKFYSFLVGESDPSKRSQKYRFRPFEDVKSSYPQKDDSTKFKDTFYEGERVRTSLIKGAAASEADARARIPYKRRVHDQPSVLAIF